jgi:exopolysaccharide biosynthesis polyprenyl glycosylphosphotransferase
MATTIDGGMGLRLVQTEWSPGDPEAIAALRVHVARPTARRRSWLMHRMLLAADLAALGASWAGATALVGRIGAPSPVILLAALPAWVLAAKLYGLYERDTAWAAYATTEELEAVFHLVTVGAWSLVVAAWLGATAAPRLTWIVAVWLIAVPAVGAARAAARGMCKQATPYRQNAIVVGAGDVGQLVARKLLQHPEYGINVVGVVDPKPRPRRRELDHVQLLGTPRELKELVDDFDVERVIVAFSDENDADTVALVRAVSELDRDVQVDIVPRLYELVGPRAFVHNIEGMPLVGIPPLRLPRSSRALKRTLDIVGSAAVLLLTAPLLALVAVLIKRDSEGPVFFRQERLGRDMRPFVLLKFRTMRVDTDPAEHLAYIRETMSAGAAPRANGLYKLDRSRQVTRVGRWLRGTSLDELPQLLNVLRGDMSLVGPRPCLATETELFAPHHFERFLVPAGLTGLWQVTARAKATFAEALDMDVAYARGWSLLLDLRLLLRTPVQLLRPGGTA